MHLGNILVIIAIVIFDVAIIVGVITPNTWKSTGMTLGILMVGIILFSVALCIQR